MSGIPKKGLDYFTMDTTWETNMRLVKAKYGLEGIGFMTELYSSIYRENYFRAWDEECELLFADELKKPVEWIHEVIEYCFNKGLLDRKIYDEKKVITSHGIQKRYFRACQSMKRMKVDFIDGITYPDLMPKNDSGIDDENSGRNADYSGIDDENSGRNATKQSKAKHTNIPNIKASKQEDAREEPLPDFACLPALLFLISEKIKSARFQSRFSEGDIKDFAERIILKKLNESFMDFCLEKVKGAKNPAGLLKEGLMNYEDWIDEWRATSRYVPNAPPPPLEKKPEPEDDPLKAAKAKRDFAALSEKLTRHAAAPFPVRETATVT